MDSVKQFKYFVKDFKGFGKQSPTFSNNLPEHRKKAHGRISCKGIKHVSVKRSNQTWIENATRKCCLFRSSAEVGTCRADSPSCVGWHERWNLSDSCSIRLTLIRMNFPPSCHEDKRISLFGSAPLHSFSASFLDVPMRRSRDQEQTRVVLYLHLTLLIPHSNTLRTKKCRRQAKPLCEAPHGPLQPGIAMVVHIRSTPVPASVVAKDTKIREFFPRTNSSPAEERTFG